VTDAVWKAEKNLPIMHSENLIENTITFVKEKLTGIEAGHNWFHTERVWKNARTICSQENAEIIVVELAALLHDVADAKFNNGDEELGSKLAASFLTKQGVDHKTVEHVENIIRNVSFAGGNHQKDFDSLELKIVQDADRLDAIGAIGIARAFNYGGYKGRELYDPEIPARIGMTKEEYRRHASPTINHFYEKLLLLKDKMNTETAKKIAEQRHAFLQLFLERFLLEWEGKL
jgi:uncharacterized protein